MKIFVVLLFLLTYVYAVPAIDRKILFVQPDGTSFEGYLKGDAAFHWIESGQDIIVYNPKDKYYYKAIVDKKRGLIPTTEKAGTSSYRSALMQTDVQDKEALYDLYKQSKNINNPR